jgi:hypothetical protein
VIALRHGEEQHGRRESAHRELPPHVAGADQALELPARGFRAPAAWPPATNGIVQIAPEPCWRASSAWARVTNAGRSGGGGKTTV